jgi:amino acid adenylation domain-containing protein
MFKMTLNENLNNIISTAQADDNGMFRSVHSRFEEQALKRPDAIAIVDNDSTLTYGKLNEQANRLAHSLIASGLKQGSLVGLCVERSSAIIVGMLAILKAGAGYIPIDRQSAKDRADHITTDSRVDFIVTDDEALAFDTIKVAYMNGGQLHDHSSQNPSIEVGPSQTAYVIYTSGSTGKPNGVVVNHYNLARLFDSTKTTFEFNEIDVWSLFHSYAFDFSVWEIWGALSHGGKLVIIPYWISRSPADFYEMLVVHGVTVLNQTPSAFKQLMPIDAKLNSELKLRCIIFGGEALNPADLKPWVGRHDEQTIELYNMYGITETTVHVTCHKLCSDDFEHSRSIIGQAICDLKLHILDDNGEQISTGEIGELYVGGAGVSEGYLHNPALTAERFNMHALNDGTFWLYKTGDLVRLLDDHNLEFLGRIDNQVNLRGFRIEIGEVEARLSKVPGVLAAVAMVKTFDSGDQLVAYLVTEDNKTLTNREIRQMLIDTLPSYMIPSFMYRIDEIPLNINGKVDMKKLSEIGLMFNDASTVFGLYVAKTNAQAEFLRLWQELLEVEEVYENDNFFDLGGHSLMATKLLYKVNELFNVAIDIRDLFDQNFKALIGLMSDQLNEAESFVIDVCTELLEEKVELSDNFFELGGHSLMATQFISRLREKYGCEIEIHMLFDEDLAVIAKHASENNINQIQSYQPIVKRANYGNTPLSFPQQRLWFLNKMEQEGANYNVAIMFNLEGHVNEALLNHSINLVIARHEDLRTTFKDNVDLPYQDVAEELLVSLNVILIEGESKDIIESKAYHTANELNVIPFDLAAGPLIRPHLIYLDKQHSILLMSIHHTIIDGWSVGVLIREIKSFYEAGSNNVPCDLPELTIQYRDYTQWQLDCFEGNKYDGQLDYWKQRLAGLPPLLSLPLDYPRPKVQSYAGAATWVHIPRTLVKKLEALSQTHGATLYMTLLSSFNVLLYNYTRQSDIAIGTPIANRTHSEIEKLIGFFTNTLVIRSQIETSDSFSQFLESVKHHVIDAYENQDFPFERVVDALQPERSLSFSPFFQVLFVLQNTPFLNESMADIKISELKLGKKGYAAAKYDLMIDIEQSDGGLDCEFVFNTDLFLLGTIERMAANYLVLLEAIVESPDIPMSRLNSLTELEKNTVIYEWNDTAYQNPEIDCIHRLVEQQVRKTPNDIAVSFFEQSITYAELNEKANQVAHFLIKQGVGPEVGVALCIERSLDLVICVLGILKAGGAYVGLDPEYPAERLNNMIVDADVSILLAETNLLKKLDSLPLTVLDVKTIYNAEGVSKENPVVDVNPDNLMVVLYTSGSTGRPKGIAVPHQSWINVLDWHYQTVSKGTDFLQFFSVSTDSFFTEMFTTLCSGGRLHMIPESLRFDSRSLLEYLVEHKVKKVNLPVVVLQQWASDHCTDLHLFEHLEDISTTGEQLQITGPVVKLFKNALKNCRLHNHYGPTETHASTYSTFEGDPESWSSHAPIGKPFINCKNYILNEDMLPVPIGAPGELYIGGVQLARGYLNRPDVTAEKFIPNPYGDDPQERLYRTGDLCRYLPGGIIEYIERIDNVVKVRGFRIELEEVEAAINQHPQIHRAVVLAKGNVASAKILVAYMVTANEQTVTISEMYEYLKNQLPDFMIPTAFVFMDDFPLNPNKKVDKNALPEPGDTCFSVDSDYVEAKTAVEIFVSNLWKDVLKVNQVGIQNNFFQLGGHSLLCAQLVNRINSIWDAGLTVVNMLSTPTVTGIIKQLEAVYGDQDTLEEVLCAWKQIEQMSEHEIEEALS